MDEEKTRLPVQAGKLSQELPTSLVFFWITRFEHFSGPEDGSLCAGVESFGVKQGPLVVIAQETKSARHHPVDALARIWPIANNVPQAIDHLNALTFDVGKDGLDASRLA